MAGPGNYSEIVRRLQPGDRLTLAPGTYRDGLDLRQLQGKPGEPITITGPETGDPAIFIGRDRQNTVRFENSAYIRVAHLTLDGRSADANGIVAEAGGDYAHDITLDHLTIRNYDISQASTAITTRSAAWNWVIRESTIRQAGTGLYLGQPDGDAPFIAGIIEGNTIEATIGYNAQIKHQKTRAWVDGMPSGRQETVIRHNVFNKAEGGSSGHRARPNLLVGHWPPEGPGSEDQYRIYGNLFYQNPHERLFQGEGHVALYNNAFVNDHGDAVLVRPHNDAPKATWILRNTVVAKGFGIRLRSPHPDYTQLVAGNAVFADPALDLDKADGAENFTENYASASRRLQAPEGELPALDLRPRGDWAVKEQALPWPDDLPALDQDRQGNPRSGRFWGAYEGRQPGGDP